MASIALTGHTILQEIPHGPGHAEAAARLQCYGRSALPAARPPGIVQVFLYHIVSPLICVLLLHVGYKNR